MNASIRPSDHTGVPETLVMPTAKQVREIADMPLDEIGFRFVPPPKDELSRLHLSYIPAMWYRYAKRESIRRISLHAYCLMVESKSLSLLIRVRRRVLEEANDDSGAIEAMLDSVPPFKQTMPVGRTHEHRPFLWSTEVKDRIADMADDSGSSMRSLLLSYGAMSLLSVSDSLGGRTKPLENLVYEWNNWIDMSTVVAGHYA